VGIVCGLLAIALTVVSFPNGFSARHVFDGTAVAFLLVTLALASHFPAEIGSDLRGAALGAAAFGFLLFIPAHQAFDRLDTIDAGGWLGVCSVLIPVGYLLVRMDPAHGHAAPARGAPTADRATALTLGGLVLVVVGVWLDVDNGGPSYWSSSHTLGLLILLLAAANLFSLWRGPADIGVLVAATTFGVVVYAWVYHAFEDLGSLGPGGWIEAIGGVVLLAGVVDARRTATALSAAAPAPAA
jgi:hypothetical protein